jgi:hypothetical protein
MMRRLVVACVIAGTAFVNQPQAQIRLGCLGTSITHIGNYTDPLAQMLGNAYALDNWGRDGTTIVRDCCPWLGSPGFNPSTMILQVIASKPDVCTMEFGANDANCWNDVGTCSGSERRATELRFTQDYNILLDSVVHNIQPAPRIFLCLPTPQGNAHSDSIIRDGIIPKIRQIAAARHYEIIDNYTPLRSHPEYFGDGLHPNAAGGQAIAQIMYQAITAATGTAPVARTARADAGSRRYGGAKRLYDITGRRLPAGVVRGRQALIVGEGIVCGWGCSH